MKHAIIYAMLTLFAGGTYAGQDIDVVSMLDANSNEVYVAAFWTRQFPKAQIKESQVLFVCPAATWKTAPAKKAALRLAAQKFLDGSTVVTTNAINAIGTTVADTNISVVVCDNVQTVFTQRKLKQPENKAAQAEEMTP